MKYTENNYPKEIQEAIKKFVEDNPRGYSRLIKSKRPDLYTFILKNTPDTLKLSTRMYWIINDIYDYPRCELCHKPFTYNIQFNIGYHRYCRKCNNSKESDRTKRANETNIKKFGCISNFGNKENRQKGVATLMKHYGVDHNWKAKEVRETGRNTCNKLYGDPNYNNREKCFQTKTALYGDPYYNNGEKISESWIKHAKEDPNFVSERNRKSKATKKEKYGDENYTNREKAVQTLLEKYHSTSPPHWTYKYDEKSFDSSYEVAYYIWLRDNGIDFQYPCPITYNYVDDSGKQRTYHPDFLVEDKVVEIKGEQFFKDKDPTKEIICPYLKGKQDLSKYYCMVKNKVIIYSNDKCKEFLDFVAEKYGKDFIWNLKCK